MMTVASLLFGLRLLTPNHIGLSQNRYSVKYINIVGVQTGSFMTVISVQFNSDAFIWRYVSSYVNFSKNIHAVEK